MWRCSNNINISFPSAKMCFINQAISAAYKMFKTPDPCPSWNDMATPETNTQKESLIFGGRTLPSRKCILKCLELSHLQSFASAFGMITLWWIYAYTINVDALSSNMKTVILCHIRDRFMTAARPWEFFCVWHSGWLALMERRRTELFITIDS